jgi:hypothetical protein
MKYLQPFLLLVFGLATFTLGSYVLSLLPIFHWAREVVILVTMLTFIPCLLSSVLWACKLFVKHNRRSE